MNLATSGKIHAAKIADAMPNFWRRKRLGKTVGLGKSSNSSFLAAWLNSKGKHQNKYSGGAFFFFFFPPKIINIASISEWLSVLVTKDLAFFIFIFS